MYGTVAMRAVELWSISLPYCFSWSRELGNIPTAVKDEIHFVLPILNVHHQNPLFTVYHCSDSNYHDFIGVWVASYNNRRADFNKSFSAAGFVLIMKMARISVWFLIHFDFCTASLCLFFFFYFYFWKHVLHFIQLWSMEGERFGLCVLQCYSVLLCSMMLIVKTFESAIFSL